MENIIEKPAEVVLDDLGLAFVEDALDESDAVASVNDPAMTAEDSAQAVNKLTEV